MRIETSHLEEMLQKIRTILLSATIAVTFLSSCRHRDIIPKDDMSRIYYDIYMTDQAVKDKREFSRMTDTLLVYEPIFNKYGYTAEDYRRSVDHYLLKPEKFEDIFQETKRMLEKRESQLKLILEAEGKRSRKWTIIDSLEIITADGIHSGMFYKNLRMMFFQADTTVPDSPVPDTAFMLRPQNPFLIFSDSAIMSDYGFAFYETPGFMEELRMREEEEKLKAEENDNDGKAEEAILMEKIKKEERIDSRKRGRNTVSILKTDTKRNPDKQK